jgi:RND family efflux transporter MFP subunit
MKKLLYFLLIIAVLASGIGSAFYFLNNKPNPKKRPLTEQAVLVETAAIIYDDINVSINAMGTIKPSRSIALASRVAGEVIATAGHFTPGRLFKKGENIIKIDPLDYELIVTQKASDVKKAEYELALENAQGSIAAEELAFLGENVKSDYKDLLLRKPNLKASEAMLEAAKAALQKAELDLNRTVIDAPFNASLQKIHVNLGSQVHAGDTLVTLVESDTFWIEALVRVEELRYMSFPSAAEVFSNQQNPYRARAIGLLHELEENARMAKVLLEVDDPLALKASNRTKTPLFINEYVTVRLKGARLSKCFKVPRHSVHGSNIVRLMTPSQRLRSQQLNVIYEDRDFVYATALGINEGELLITSALATAVEGMALRKISNEN